MKKNLTLEEFELDLLRALELLQVASKNNFEILLKNKKLYNEYSRLFDIYQNLQLRKRYNSFWEWLYVNQNFFDNTMKFLQWMKINCRSSKKWTINILLEKIKNFIK